MAVTVPNDGLQWMADMLAQTNPFSCHLAQGTMPTGVTPTIGSFTEATFPGYASTNFYYPVPTLDTAVPQGEDNSSALSFSCSGGGAAQTITGWYVTASDPYTGGTTRVIMYAPISPSVVMQNTGDSITITPSIYVQA